MRIQKAKEYGMADVRERKQNDVLMVIPAYNEADSIEQVVDRIVTQYPELDYIVVTDGSTDGTDAITRRRGYHAIHLTKNLGLAGAFQVGMRYADEHAYRYAVQFDGDGQHKPEYIHAMWKKAEEGYDIVMGSRFIGPRGEAANIGGMRNIGSKLIRLSIRLKTGVTVTDPTCGLRMYNASIIRRFAHEDALVPEPNTIARLIREGAKVAEVPVTVADRQAGESYLKPMRAVKYMWRMLSSILFG